MNKIELLPHQVKALDQTKGMSRVAYYLDMGLGKTFVAGEKAEILGNDIILIVCQKSKLEDWKDHYQTYYPHYNVIIYNKELEKVNPGTVLIINYDLVWRRSKLKKLKNVTLILDESSYIKNPTRSRSKFILKLKVDAVILLSGTPTGGKYEDLHSQIKLLGWNITKAKYWDTYIKYTSIKLGSFKIKKVTGYKHVDRLKRKLRDHGAVFMKTEDVITLPSQLEYEISVPNTNLYKQFKKDRIIEIEDTELIGDTSLTKMLYLRQLAAMYNKHKYDKVTELMESTEDRLIIFYNFTYELNNLIDICNKLKKPYSCVNGSVRDLNNYDTCDNSITLIQYKAGSMGLNLQKANSIIYFSPPLESDLFEQSKKRTHRLGQTRSCFYYYIITKNSIEVDIYKTLKERKNYTDILFQED